MHWEHHPSHFWLVLLTAAGSVALAYVTNVVATRQRDARLVLVSLAFLASAGFLGLHALATPGVLLDTPNAGFVARDAGRPVHRIVLRGRLGDRARRTSGSDRPAAAAGPARVHRRTAADLGVRLARVAAAAQRPAPRDRSIRTARASRDRRRGSVRVRRLPLLPLLPRARRGPRPGRRRGHGPARRGDARDRDQPQLAAQLVVMARADARVASSRSRSARGPSTAGAARSPGPSGASTSRRRCARIDRWHGRAIAAVAAAGDRPEATDRVLDELRHEGASSDEIALVAEAAGEVKRLDSLFRPYLPSHVASGLRDEPSVGRLGGVEREVSVMFADLAGFTTFSETRSPSVVIAMLNRYWADVVPLIDASGGVIEQFAGDGVMASFNTTGEMADHAAPSCRGRTRDRRGGAPLAAEHPAGRCSGRASTPVPRWSAPSVRPSAAASRSSATRRTPRRVSSRSASRDRSSSRSPRGRHWARRRDGIPLGPTRVKGRRGAVEAWILRGTG